VNRKVIVCAALASLALAVAAQAQVLYTRGTTRLRDSQGLGGKIVGSLAQGTPVQVLQDGTRYCRVSTDGMTGYLRKADLTESKPEDVTAALRGAPGTSNIRLAELQTSGAMRGLSKNSLAYAESRQIPVWARQAVDQMRAVSTTPEEMDAFEKAGGLGDYAGDQ